MELDNNLGYIHNYDKEYQRTDGLLELDRESNFFFVSLIDKNAEINREPKQGYFALISAIFGEKNLVTYNAVLNHCEMYLGKAIDSAIDTLNEQEKEILIKRYGLKNGKQRTLEDVGRDYYLSRERVRQIEEKAIRKMRHPSRSSVIKKILYNKVEHIENDKIDLGHGRCLEELIRNEITAYNSFSSVKKEDFLFYKLLNSPRFSFRGDYLEMDIEGLNISVRTKNCLKRACIDSLIDLMRLTMDDMGNMRNLGRKSAEEIIEIQEKTKWVDAVLAGMEHYKLDEDKCFSIADEIPLTRTKLSAKDMLGLLLDGFFYVSDVLDYYDVIAPRDEEMSKRHFLSDERAISVLKYYASPVLRIKISTKLQKAMRTRGVTTLKELEEKQNVFSENMKNEITSILQMIKVACEEYCI